MRCLSIRGGNRLSGEIRVQGAKNSVLPILAASVLCRGQVRLRRCPRLLDVSSAMRILSALGCSARWEGEDLLVDASRMDGYAISDALMREMRSSVVFLGAVLARCGRAACSLPGGCELGPRPIDLHLSGLRCLGADITDVCGSLDCKAAHLTGREIVLATPSVGATENLMLAGCGAEGVTVIANAAREPEIADLQTFLNACGGEVRGAGTGCVSVTGGRQFHGCDYTVMPDRIAAATYLCAAAAAGGDIFLRDGREGDLSAVTALLRQCGCEIKADRAGIACAMDTPSGRPRAVRPVVTAPFPGFPTDAQAPLMAALLRARGSTLFEENLFESRYRHVDELRRMGADVRVSGRAALVNGVARLHGAAVECTDLRGGAALCVAALSAEGETRVGTLRHIDRGYEDLARDLRALGADAERVETG